MAMPTEASIYCSKCDIYNISSDNCFCDDCLQELKEKYLDEFVQLIILNIPLVGRHHSKILEFKEYYETNKEGVGE